MTSGTARLSDATRTTPLQTMRESRGLSREVLAADAGLSPRTIYALEIEGVRPQRATRRVLALALSCAVEDLFPRDEREAGKGLALQAGDGSADGGSG